MPGYGGLSVTLAAPASTTRRSTPRSTASATSTAPSRSVDRPAQEGDTVTIDIAGTLDGEAQPGLTADDYSYTVGSGAITPEVDEQLVGAERATPSSFSATHPDPEEERELQFELHL